MAKPRKKKYDPNKALKRHTLRAEHGTMLLQAQGLGKAGKVWVSDNKPVPNGEWLTGINLHRYRLVFLTPHKWTIVAGVACRDQLGKNFFRFAQQSSNNEFVYHDPQIQQWIMDFVAEQILAVNKEQILSSFFIALPYQTELAESDIDKLLHWLNIFDPAQLKTHFEMVQVKAAAEAEVADVPLEDYLPKQTACVLRKHGINDLMSLFWQDAAELKALKGIGEARYRHVEQGLKALMEQCPNFRLLAWDNHRGEMCREFIFADAANSEKMYQLYLETKKK